jgi:hypothetical protein
MRFDRYGLQVFLQAHMIMMDIMNPKNTDSGAHIKKGRLRAPWARRGPYSPSHPEKAFSIEKSM